MCDMPRLKVLKNALYILHNGVFGCHGNTCYVILIGTVFCMIHNIGQINAMNACTDFEINRYKIDEVTKYANIVFYLTSQNGLSHVMGT